MMQKSRKHITGILLSLSLVLILSACTITGGQTGDDRQSLTNEGNAENSISDDTQEYEESSIPVTDETEEINILEEENMKIKVTDGKNTVIFKLNDTTSAQSLYGMLPIDVTVENYSTNEKIFYTDEKIDTAGGIEGNCEAGTLALFSPWGNVVMFYGSFRSYPGLYILGEASEGTDQIKKLSGNIHVEKVED